MLLVFFPFSVRLQPVPTFSSGSYHRMWRGLGRIWGGDGAVDVSVLAVGLMSVLGLLFLASGGSISLAVPFPSSCR